MNGKSPVVAPLTSRGMDELVGRGGTGNKTIGDLLVEAGALAKNLPQGRYAVNLATNRYHYLRSFCATTIAGHCTLMPPNRQAETLAEIERLYPQTYRIGENGVPAPEVTGREGRGTAQPPAIEDHRVVAIAFTSGSTGEPTPIPKQWRTLRAGTANNYQSMLGGLSGCPHLVATVPCQHMWGFEASVLLPLLAPVAISDRSPLYPLDIANALAEGPEPRVLVSSPLHLRSLMRSGVEVPGIARILTATAPLAAEEAQEFEEHFSTEVLDVFGCSESGVIATRRTARDSEWSLTPPFTLESADTCTAILAAHLPDKVLMPDLVKIIDDRRFLWIGRNQDMVNIAGKRGSLADLNRRLLSIRGVLDGIILQPDGAQRLAAMVVAPGLTAKEIIGALKPQVDPAFLPRPVYLVRELPRQETGKLSRAAAMDMYHELRGNHSNGSRDRSA